MVDDLEAKGWGQGIVIGSVEQAAEILLRLYLVLKPGDF